VLAEGREEEEPRRQGFGRDLLDRGVRSPFLGDSPERCLAYRVVGFGILELLEGHWGRVVGKPGKRGRRTRMPRRPWIGWKVKDGVLEQRTSEY